jgi:hypothetical protein
MTASNICLMVIFFAVMGIVLVIVRFERHDPSRWWEFVHWWDLVAAALLAAIFTYAIAHAPMMVG